MRNVADLREVLIVVVLLIKRELNCFSKLIMYYLPNLQYTNLLSLFALIISSAIVLKIFYSGSTIAGFFSDVIFTSPKNSASISTPLSGSTFL
jgi:hypothetical protein